MNAASRNTVPALVRIFAGPVAPRRPANEPDEIEQQPRQQEYQREVDEFRVKIAEELPEVHCLPW